MSHDAVVRQARRWPAVVLAVTTSGLAVLATVVLATELSQPAYIMPVSVLALAATCVVLTAIGGAVAARRRHLTPWLAPAVTCVLLVASLEFFVVTIPLVVLLVLISLRAARRSLGSVPIDQSVGVPGFLLTIGLVPLFLLLFLGGPVVSCMPGGSSSGIPVWAWFGSGAASSFSGTGSGSSDSRVSTGTETANGTTYSWVCQGNDVVRFSSKR